MASEPIALYVCYFGLREPLVQTQVIPYLRELAASGIEMHLLTFEPVGIDDWEPGEAAQWREGLAAKSIRWTSLRYHSRPTLPATSWDILRGAIEIVLLVRRNRIRILHARSHVACAMSILAGFMMDVKVIFDIRGVLADEYTDAGHWPRNGFLFRVTKRVERLLLERSDGFVVLTSQAKSLLFPEGEVSRPVEVIPCCIDRKRFASVEGLTKGDLRARFGIPSDARVVIYVGALGGWYLTEETAALVAEFFKMDERAFCVVLTQSVSDELVKFLTAGGVSMDRLIIRQVGSADVPAWLRASDFGLSLIRPVPSKRASSPTKVAEYLAAGLPFVSTPGIGDLDDLIETQGVGVIVNPYDRESCRRAVSRIRDLSADEDVRRTCEEVAGREFDLVDVGGTRYKRLYGRVLKDEP